jgi:raffinose/stachyose/melibiose transport system permease protein
MATPIPEPDSRAAHLLASDASAAASPASAVSASAAPSRRSAASSSARNSPGPRRARARKQTTIIVFLLPALLLFGGLVLLPIGLAIYTSLFKWNGFGGLPTQFIGLDNFRRLLEDEVFTGDLKRGLVLVLLSVLVQLPVALGLALLLNQRLRFRGLYRLIFFAPYVLSEVITGVLFSMVLSPTGGLVNEILGVLGLPGQTWLSDPSRALWALFCVVSWKYFGFHMILMLAGRQEIPPDLDEAGMMDGAGSWQIFRHITLPLMGPTIRISAFLSIIGAIQLFDMVWVLTGGGPIHASETMAVTMFQYGFRRYEVDYASAISVAMFVISMSFALLYQRYVLRRDIEGAVTRAGGMP